MNLGCSIFTKGKLIIKELVSEVGVLSWRAKKGVADWRLLPNFYYYLNIITFEVLGDAQVGNWLLLTEYNDSLWNNSSVWLD